MRLIGQYWHIRYLCRFLAQCDMKYIIINYRFYVYNIRAKGDASPLSSDNCSCSCMQHKSQYTIFHIQYFIVQYTLFQHSLSFFGSSISLNSRIVYIESCVLARRRVLIHHAIRRTRLSKVCWTQLSPKKMYSK